MTKSKKKDGKGNKRKNVSAGEKRANKEAKQQAIIPLQYDRLPRKKGGVHDGLSSESLCLQKSAQIAVNGGAYAYTNRAILSPASVEYDMKYWKRDVKAATNEGLRTYQFVLRDDFALTTDGSGVLADVFSNNPSVCAEWADLAAYFEQYRVLAFVIQDAALEITGGATATYRQAISTVIDRTDATALTSYDLADEYDGVQQHSANNPIFRAIPMAGVTASAFKPVGAPTADAWTKMFSSGNSASITLAHVTRIYLVEFWGTGINKLLLAMLGRDPHRLPGLIKWKDPQRALHEEYCRDPDSATVPEDAWLAKRLLLNELKHSTKC